MTFANPDLVSSLEHGVRCWRAGSGRVLIGLAGPPTGALLFRHLATPALRAGWELVLPELFHPPPPSATPAALAERLAPLVPADAVVFAHGLALPVALELVRRVPVAGLVIANGPLERLDLVSRAMAGLARAAPGLCARLALRPRPLVDLLASSVALRRTVTNPYVFDRDIVAMLSAPLIATLPHRRALTEFLAALGDCHPPWPRPEVPVLVLWGAADLVYPQPADPAELLGGADVEAVSLAGARLFFVEERPWEAADAVFSWAARRLPEPTTTSMSRFGDEDAPPSAQAVGE